MFRTVPDCRKRKMNLPRKFFGFFFRRFRLVVNHLDAAYQLQIVVDADFSVVQLFVITIECVECQVTILFFRFSDLASPAFARKSLSEVPSVMPFVIEIGIFVVSRSPYSEVTKQLRTVVASAP